MPTGGTTGQLLKKASGTNFDLVWFSFVPGTDYITPTQLVSVQDSLQAGIDGKMANVAESDLPLMADWVALFEANRQAVVADATAISTLVDSSGNSHDATQTGSARPVYKIAANGINGQPVVRFDGTDDYLQTAAGAATLSGDCYFACVARFTNLNSPAFQFTLGWGDHATHGDIRGMLKYNTNKITFNGFGADLVPTTIGLSQDTPYLFEIIISSGTIYIYVNGALALSGAPSNALVSYTSPKLTLGNGADVANPFAGDLALAMFLGEVPSAELLRRIRGYVLLTYGIVSAGVLEAGSLIKATAGIPVVSSLYDNGHDIAFFDRRLYGVAQSDGTKGEHVLKSAGNGYNTLLLQNTNGSGFSAIYGIGYDVVDPDIDPYGWASGFGNAASTPVFASHAFTEAFNFDGNDFLGYRIVQTSNLGNYLRFEVDATTGDFVFYRRDAAYPSASEAFRIKEDGTYLGKPPTSNPGPGILWNNAGLAAIGT